MKYKKEIELLNFIVKNCKKNDPAQVLKYFDIYSTQHEWMMHIGREKGDILKNIIKQNKPQNIIELGGYCGYSAILMASQLQDSSNIIQKEKDIVKCRSNINITLISIEKEPIFASISTYLQQFAGVGGQSKVEIGTSQTVLPDLIKNNELDKIDLLFIDHQKQLYQEDLEFVQSLDLLKKDSIVVADNIIYPGAPEYLEFMQKNKDYKSEIIKCNIIKDKDNKIQDAMLISKKLN